MSFCNLFPSCRLVSELSSGMSFLCENIQTGLQNAPKMAKSLVQIYADCVSKAFVEMYRSCMYVDMKITTFSQMPQEVQSVAKEVIRSCAEWVAAFMDAALRCTNIECLDPELNDIDPSAPVVILVHGFFGSVGSFAYQRKCLMEAGVKNVFTINLGHPFHSIDEYADILAEKIRSIKSLFQNMDLILVGHSMGGLVSREYRRRYAQEEQVNVRKIITIGTPLKGTYRAYLVSWMSRAASQMEPGSSFIVSQQEYAVSDSQTKYVHIASEKDTTVPIVSATTADGLYVQEELVDTHGHLGMLLSTEVSEILIQHLKHS